MDKFKQSLKELRCSSQIEDHEKLTKGITDSDNSFCYVWDAKNCNVMAAKLDGSETVRIVPTDTPLFNVTGLKVCPTGKWLLLSGSKGVVALNLPQKITSGDGEIICRVLPIGDRFYSTYSKTCVLQIEWYPQSSPNCTLVVLSSDNNLRFFDLEANNQYPEQTVQLGTCKSFGNSGVSVKAALGGTAVGFAFGPSADEQLWPVFVLRGDGSVVTLLTGVGDNAIYQPDVSGPLTMMPESESNYGADSCSILCIQAAAGAPPILVIATESGILYHFVVLNHAAKDAVLYAYESVELELGLDLNDSLPFNCPIKLVYDPLASGHRYLCHHRAGVHCVALPMAAHLAELAMSEDNLAQITNHVQEDSVVEYLICTRLKDSFNPVIGATVAVQKLTSNVVCFLNDYTAQVLALSFDPYHPRLSTHGKSTLS